MKPSAQAVRIAQAILADSGLYMAEHVKLLSAEIVRLSKGSRGEADRQCPKCGEALK